jgi:hypothetical protein
LHPSFTFNILNFDGQIGHQLATNDIERSSHQTHFRLVQLITNFLGNSSQIRTSGTVGRFSSVRLERRRRVRLALGRFKIQKQFAVVFVARPQLCVAHFEFHLNNITISSRHQSWCRQHLWRLPRGGRSLVHVDEFEGFLLFEHSNVFKI